MRQGLWKRFYASLVKALLIAAIFGISVLLFFAKLPVRALEKLNRSSRGSAIAAVVIALSIMLFFVWLFGIKPGLYIAGFLGLYLTWYPALKRGKTDPHHQNKDTWRATQKIQNYFRVTPWWVYVGGIAGGLLLFLLYVLVS